MLPQNGIKEFQFLVYEDLKQCVDSMLFDSDTTIASFTGIKDCISVEVSLMVRGEVSVDFKGKTYRKPSEFPQELKDRIRANPNKWDNGFDDVDLEDLSEEQLEHLADLFDPEPEDEEPDVYVSCSNWFEYIYTINDGVETHSDGILFEGMSLHTLSEDELKAEMLKVAEEVIEK